MSIYTRGPWHVLDLSHSSLHPILSIETDRPSQVCEIDLTGLPPGTVEKAKADAWLLAAAPCLLEACKALLKAEWMVTHDWGGDRDSVIKMVEAAIRKAEGR